jgi:hypothetical protein
MECRLDVNKIKQGITDRVKELVPTSLFRVEGDNIISHNELKGVLGEVPEDILNEALLHKDDIKGISKDMFLSMPHLFLKELAFQANSSALERRGAVEVAGSYLVELALKAYPNEGKPILEQSIIDGINKAFNDVVIVQVTPNTWEIKPTEQVVMEYIVREKGGYSILADYARRQYIEKAGLAVNLINEDLWLNFPNVYSPSIQNLLSFMKKINPDAKVSEFQNINERTVSLIGDYIILIKNGSMIDDLPHEVAHFFLELLPDDHIWKKEMLKEILNLPKYKEVYAKYKDNKLYQKNGLPDFDKIKKEAVAQLIGEYVVAAYRNQADGKYGKKRGFLRDVIARFFHIIRKLFNLNSPPLYREYAGNAFEKAAQSIVNGDVSKLDITKVPTAYDSIFFSILDETITPSYETNDVVKSMYELAKALRQQASLLFRRDIEGGKMEAFKEELQEKGNEHYNKIWDVIRKFEHSEKLFQNMMSDVTYEFMAIQGAAHSLADAYRTMIEIPDAMEKAIKKLKNDGTLDTFLNSITELQSYSSFISSFKTMTEEYTSLLAIVRTKYPNIEEGGKIYDTLSKSIGDTENRFKVVDNIVKGEFKEFYIKVFDKWTENFIKAHRKDLEERYSTETHSKIKQMLIEEIYGKITSVDQLWQLLNGKLPDSFLEIDGRKIDIRTHVKDASLINQMLFYTTSASLIGDPLISTAVKYYYDTYVTHRIKGDRQSRLFLNEIRPLVKDTNMGWYDMNRAIQSSQKIFDPTQEEKMREVRALLSETDRFTANFEKRKKQQEIKNVLNDLTILINEARTNPSDELTKQIKKKDDEYSELRSKYSDWLNEWWNGPYTKEYYEYEKMWKDNKTDSSLLRNIKDIKRRLHYLQESQLEGMMVEMDTIDSEYFINVSIRIAQLQSELAILEKELPEIDKALYEKMDEIFEINEEATSRLISAHKNRIVNDLANRKIEKLASSKSKEEEIEDLEKRYDNLYRIVKPTQAYWDKRQEIFNQISEMNLSFPVFNVLEQRIKDVADKEKLIKKYLKDERGEINLASARFSYIGENETPVIDILKELEQLLEDLRKRSRVYSTFVNTAEDWGNAENFKNRTEFTLGIVYIAENANTIKADRVQSLFSQLFELTVSQANQIIDIVKNAKPEDSLERILLISGLDISKIQLTLKNYPTLSSIIKLVEDTESLISQTPGMPSTEEVTALYDELAALSTNDVSYHYVEMMRPFLDYARMYVNDVFQHPAKEVHRDMLARFDDKLPSDLQDWEDLLNAGSLETEDGSLFEIVLLYMKYKAEEDKVAEEIKQWSISDQIHFYNSLHTKKLVWTEDGYIPKISTLKAVRKINPNAVMQEDGTSIYYGKVEYPKFLTTKKVKDIYINEKIKETDPRVIAGTHQANMDINGKWLPLAKKDSPFWNEKHEQLKNNSSQREVFNLLNKVKLLYLQKQEETLPEGERLDLLVPTRYLDKLEQKLLALKKVDEVIKYFKALTTKLGGRDMEIEQQAYLEDIGALTSKQVSDIYKGTLKEEAIKMRSKRRIPYHKTSEDVIASVVMFIEDVNEFTGKSLVAPVLTGISQMLEDVNKAYPDTNAIRSEIMRKFTDTKVYNKVPKNIVNTPAISSAINTVLQFAGLRLMADVIGGMVTLGTGYVQLLEGVTSKETAQRFASSSKKAWSWMVDYDKDYWDAENQGLVSQLITSFNMLPDARVLSTLLSTKALAADLRSHLMAPRSEAEKQLAIQTALSLLLGEDIVVEGRSYKFDELYELGGNGLAKLKDKFKHLEKEWDPENGTKVVFLRGAVMQLYTLLHGNYYKQMESYLSNFSAGKALEMMKKYIVSMGVRRFQGRVLDPFLGKPRVGIHYASMALTGQMIKAVWNRDPSRLKSYWKQFTSRPFEKQAMWQSAAELFYVTLATIMVPLIFGYGGSDDNDELEEMSYLKQLALLVAMRVQGEIGTFIPLPVFGLGYMEMKRAVLDPFGIPKVTVDNMAAIGKLLVLHAGDLLGLTDEKFLYYQNRKRYNYWFQGLGVIKDKGDSKLIATFWNTIGYTGYTFEPVPYIMTFTQMQNRLK